MTIDDACMFLAVFANGSMGTFESTRYARGRKNYNTLRAQRRERLRLLRPGRPAPAGLLPLRRPGDRQEDRRPLDRLAEDQRHEFRASLHEELVGARLHDRLRTHVHQRLCRFPGEPRRRAEIRADHARPPWRRSGSATPCWKAPSAGNGSRFRRETRWSSGFSRHFSAASSIPVPKVSILTLAGGKRRCYHE